MAASTWGVSSGELGGISDLQITFDSGRVATRIEYSFRGALSAYSSAARVHGGATVSDTSVQIALDWNNGNNFAFEGTLKSDGTAAQGDITFRIVEGPNVELGSGDATLNWQAPGPERHPFYIGVTSSVDTARLNWQTDLHECWFSLTARATGGNPGEYGTWLPSGVRWLHYGPPRCQTSSYCYFDTEMNAQAMAGLWGSDRIVTGETQVGNRMEESAQPFKIVLSVRWGDLAGRVSVWVDTLDCR